MITTLLPPPYHARCLLLLLALIGNAKPCFLCVCVCCTHTQGRSDHHIDPMRLQLAGEPSPKPTRILEFYITTAPRQTAQRAFAAMPMLFSFFPFCVFVFSSSLCDLFAARLVVGTFFFSVFNYGPDFFPPFCFYFVLFSRLEDLLYNAPLCQIPLLRL